MVRVNEAVGWRLQSVIRYFSCLTSEGVEFLPFVYMQNMGNGRHVHSNASFTLDKSFDVFVIHRCKVTLSVEERRQNVLQRSLLLLGVIVVGRPGAGKWVRSFSYSRRTIRRGVMTSGEGGAILLNGGEDICRWRMRRHKTKHGFLRATHVHCFINLPSVLCNPELWETERTLRKIWTEIYWYSDRLKINRCRLLHMWTINTHLH